MSRTRAQTVTTTPPARTAVLYVRVSSKEKEQGLSIPAQRKLLIEYAGQHRLNVVREFEDVETAATQTRTTGSDRHLGSCPCRQCGGQINGRRRNRFCSDRCRMDARRERETKRRPELMRELHQAVQALETHLWGVASAAGGEDGQRE